MALTTLVYYNVENRYIIAADSVAKGARPEFFYTTQPSIVVYLKNSDGTKWTGLHATDTVMSVMDDDWSSSSDPLVRTLSANIVVDAVNGTLTIAADLYTELLETAIEGQASINVTWEIQIYALGEAQPSRIFQIGATIKNSVDATGGSSPSAPVDNYYTKTQTDALLAAKQDVDADAVEHNLAWFDADGDTEDSGIAVSTSVGTPGVDTNIPTEKAVRTAFGTYTVGAASATDGEFALFDGTGGKTIKSSGGILPSTAKVADPGVDTKIPTEQAVREALNDKQDLDTDAIENNLAKFDAAKKTVDSGIAVSTAVVADPGVDTKVPTEQAVREALDQFGKSLAFSDDDVDSPSSSAGYSLVHSISLATYLPNEGGLITWDVYIQKGQTCRGETIRAVFYPDAYGAATLGDYTAFGGTPDIGDTKTDFGEFTVDISGGNVRLLCDPLTDGWLVKGTARIIAK